METEKNRMAGEALRVPGMAYPALKDGDSLSVYALLRATSVVH